MAVTKVAASGWKAQGVLVNDIQVLGEQGALIADLAATGEPATLAAAGVDTDAAVVVVNLILARLRAHGIIATA